MFPKVGWEKSWTAPAVFALFSILHKIKAHQTAAKPCERVGVLADTPQSNAPIKFQIYADIKKALKPMG